MQSSPPVKVGDVLGGKYRLERIIGQGGMGIVFAARHVELNQRVAVKVLLPDASNERQHVERFMREARAAVRLKSEHSVRVTDVGRLRSGAPFMVMELLDGADLAQVAAHAPLPIPLAIDVMLQACEGIAEAHALGMVHRDVKPSNLNLVRGVHGVPLVKVLDFGLAKHRAVEADALTKSAVVMGSPPYMSPEQLKSLRDVDARTDIWSLGVTLYELLTGHVPFAAATVPEVCARVLMGEPTRPDPTRVPDELWHVIAWCLAKDPAQRPQSVWELATALQPFAGPDARGSADRVANVLRATSTSSHPPPEPADAGGGADTVTASSFDPRARDRSPRRRALVVGACAFVSVVGTASLAVVVGRRVLSPANSAVLSASNPAPVAPVATASAPAESEPPAAISAGNIADAQAPLAVTGDAGILARPIASPPRLGPPRLKGAPVDPNKNPAARF